MNILLIYPKFPDTIWSFSYALQLGGKKSAFPPIGSESYRFGGLACGWAFWEKKGSSIGSCWRGFCAEIQTASVGSYPGYLRLPLPEDMRVAYPLSKGSKNLCIPNGIRLNKQASLKLIGSLIRR